MGNKDKGQHLLNEFGRQIAQKQLPELKAGESVRLKFTVPDLALSGNQFNQALLKSAQLHFSPSRDVNIALVRSGDTVNLKLVKRF